MTTLPHCTAAQREQRMPLRFLCDMGSSFASQASKLWPADLLAVARLPPMGQEAPLVPFFPAYIDHVLVKLKAWCCVRSSAARKHTGPHGPSHTRRLDEENA